MQEDYMKTRLRDAIFREVTAYISEVYADDTHFNDCIFVRTYDEEVSHGRRSYEEHEEGYKYFDMCPLLSKPSTFTFEPNPVGIEVVVNKFYPDERISKFVEDAKATINEFLKTHGYSEEAELSFPIDTFKTYVCCPSEMETTEASDDEELTEDEIMNCVEWETRQFSFPIDTFKTYVSCPSEMETTEAPDDEELTEDEIMSYVAWETRPLRKYVRNTRDRGIIVQEDRLESLAAEMLLEYDDFMKSDTKK